VPATTQTLRIFVSSTFEDLQAERNALQERVFPQLAAVCRERGQRFQAVDLRWGIREEAAHDHKTMEICFAEVERCKQTGLKPNLIVLLGERYGWRPLPSRISLSEFEALLGCMQPSEQESLVYGEGREGWYRMDENAIPPEYVLLPRTGQYLDSAVWRAVETRLHEILESAAHAAKLPTDSIQKYTTSASHQEILAGIGENARDRDHVFVFYRASRHLRDQAVQTLIAEMRLSLPFGQVVEFASNDIDGFCRRVFDSLRNSIGWGGGRYISSFETLRMERWAHDIFGRDRSRFFRGREATIRAIEEYLRDGDNRPLVLHGPSGSGKSSILAQVSERHPGIRRFIGVTAESSSGTGLVKSVYDEINERYGKGGGSDPITSLRYCLTLATAEKPLHLYVDALDQLPADDPTSVKWLPTILPPHCKIVFSTTRVPVPLEDARLLHLNPFSVEEAEELLRTWLEDANRTLTLAQKRNILAKFKLTGLPLYLKLAFEEARLWTSFDPPERCRLGTNLPGMLDVLFARLAHASHHGRVLVRQTMAYLTVCRFGLTEDEILDVLAADEAVWKDFQESKKHAFSGPLEANSATQRRQLPPIIWSRLFFDLEPYLTERQVPGGGVVSFFHRGLSEQVPSEASHREALASYFAAQALWLEPNRPNLRALTETVRLLTTAGRSGAAEAFLTDIQFIEAKCAAGLLFDLEEDFQIVLSLDGEGRRGAVRDFSQFVAKQAHILSERPWLLRQQAINEPDGSPVRTAVFQENAASAPYFDWRNKPQNADPLIRRIRCNSSCGGAFLPGGCHVIAGRGPDLIMWDIDTGREVVTFANRHTQSITACAVSLDGRRIATVGGPLPSISRGEDDRSVRIWDAQTGRHLHCLTTGKEKTDPELRDDQWKGSCGFSPDGRRIAVSLPFFWERRGVAEHELRIWDVESGKGVDFVSMPNMRFLDWMPDGRILAYRFEHGRTGLHLLDGRTGDSVQVLGGDTYGYTHSGRCSPDGKWIMSVTGSRGLRVWDARTGKLVKVLVPPPSLVHGPDVWSCVWSPDGKLIAAGKTDRSLEIYDVETGELRATVGRTSGYFCAWSDDGSRLLSAGSNVEIWDVARICRPVPTPDSVMGRSTSLDYSPDGNGVATITPDHLTIHVWISNPPKLVATFRSSGIHHIHAPSYSPDGDRIATTGGGGVWNVPTGELIFHNPEGIQSLSWAPDGSAIGYLRGGDELVLYNARDWQKQFSIKTPPLRKAKAGFSVAKTVGEKWSFLHAKHCAFTPDQQWIIVGGSTLVSCSTKEALVLDCPGFRGDGKWALRGDGRKICLPGSTYGTVYLIDPRDSNLKREFQTTHYQALKFDTSAYSHDGRLLFCHVGDVLTVWDVESLERIATFACTYSTAGIHRLQLRTGGRITLVGSEYSYELRLVGVTSGPAITTAVHAFDWRTGEWSATATARCRMCGFLFDVSAGMSDTLCAILRNSELNAGDSPCEWLPNEAWEDARLLTTCSSCGHALRFNPWIVDSRNPA
jgi:WD40 repeat protein